MRIAQLSDTHLLTAEDVEPAASLRADCLRRAVEDINRQQPDAVIFTGDTVQHGQPEEYARLRELVAPLEAPLYITPGNRDDKEALRLAFDDWMWRQDDNVIINRASVSKFGITVGEVLIFFQREGTPALASGTAAVTP